jgi:hypothetical protein
MIIEISNAEDLRLRIGRHEATIVLLGINTPGDNEGGLFFWDESSVLNDDNFDVFKVVDINTGRWIRATSGVVDFSVIYENLKNDTEWNDYLISQFTEDLYLKDLNINTPRELFTEDLNFTPLNTSKTFTLATQSPRYAFLAPTSGVGKPLFRAIELADISDYIATPQIDINNWNEAYNWGDHSTQGYLTSGSDSQLLSWDLNTKLLTISTGNTILIDGFANTIHNHTVSDITDFPTLISYFGNDVNYLTTFVESDPIFLAHVTSNITGTQISNWDLAYSWGTHTGLYSLLSHNHDSVYEPIFTKNTAFNKNFGTTTNTIIEGNDTRVVNGQTSFLWGNHSLVGYLTVPQSLTWNPTNGNLTISQGNVESLDGRYSLLNHTHTISEIVDYSPYVHPSYTTITTTLTGVKILSSISFTNGHLTSILTRDLQLTDLGYIGALNANNYILPKAESGVLGGIKVGAGLSIDVDGVLNANYTYTIDEDLEAIADLTGSIGLLRKTASDTWEIDINSYVTTSTLSNFYLQTEIDNFFSNNVAIIGYNKTNWDIAFGWGNHSTVGYLTNYQTLSFNSSTGILGISSGNNVDLNTRYHSISYLNQTFSSLITLINSNTTNITNNTNTLTTKENSFNKNTAFNKNFGTTSNTIVEGNDSRVINGQTAFGWGDHSTEGYITSYTNNYVTGGSLSTTTLSLTRAGLTAITVDLSSLDTRYSQSAINYWTKTGNDLSYTIGNVAIGMTSTSYKLGITGDSYYGGKQRIQYLADSSYLDIQGYGLEFGRNTSYLRPTANVSKNLNIGYTSLNWYNISLTASYVTLTNQQNWSVLGTNSYGEIIETSNASVLTKILAVDGSGSGLDADLLDGYNSSTSATANTVVVRDANRYIRGGFIHSDRGDETTAAASYIYDSGDGWIRKKTLSNARIELVTASDILTKIKTVDGSGSGLNADLLDGYNSSYFINNTHTKVTATANLAIGWYTIAINYGNRAVASFGITDEASSKHQSTLFNAGHHYGGGNNINVLSNSKYGANNPYSKIRLKKGSTYDGVMLQVYVGETVNYLKAYILGDNIHSASGWVIKSFIPDGTDPGGLPNYAALTTVAAEVTLTQISNGGMIATGDLYTGGTTTQYKVLTTVDENNYLKSNASDSVTAGVIYTFSGSDTAPLSFANSSYASSTLQIGGWSGSNTNGISRIRNSSVNLHIDSAANGALYLNNFSAGNTYIRGQIAWHAGNDGASSGLDADLLDGLHESSFVRTSTGISANLDNELRAGMTSWSTTTTGTKPEESYGQIINIVSSASSHNNSSNWITQLGFGTNNTTSYFRGKVNAGAWGDWHTIWNSANDGSGSGLDADLLDGQHASEMSWGYDEPHGTYSDFNSVMGTARFGNAYVAGITNSPGQAGATQYYAPRYSIGSNYNNYSLQLAMARGRTDNYMWYRNEENGVLSSWYKFKAGDSDTVEGISSSSFLRSDAVDSFNQTITMSTQKAFVASNYGHGMYGIYSPSRYQHVWSMGTAYNLSADGTSSSNLYGLAFTHTNIGGQSKSGLQHQLMVMLAGTTQTSIGTGIWTLGLITTTNYGNSSQWNQAYSWGNHASYNYLVKNTGYFWTGRGSNALSFQNLSGESGTTSDTAPLEVYQATIGADAFMQFHVASSYALNFGIDGATNDIFVGGWSMGAVKHKIWHAGNDGGGSGLNADLWDGYQFSTYLNQAVLTTSSPTFNTVTAASLSATAANSRTKFSLWGAGSVYGIGMGSSYSFGGLDNEYAMTFQMNSDDDRGFWWGDNNHTNSQGAMSLTTGGKLNVALSLKIGWGESSTVTPGLKASLEVLGSSWLSDGIMDAGLNRILSPGGGVSINNGATQTGAIRIKLPTVGWGSYPMLRFTVKIYNYLTGTSQTFETGGHISGNDWHAVFCTQQVDGNSVNLTVRFGNNGTNNIVWIGETDTTWDYCNVFITDVQIGYSSYSEGYWKKGWAVDFTTSFDTVYSSRVASLQLNNRLHTYAATMNQNVKTTDNVTFNQITTTNDLYMNGWRLYGDSKAIMQYDDLWLRINPGNQFSSGIYCNTGILRTDGEFQVGASGASFRITSSGVGTIAGAFTVGGILTENSSLRYKYNVKPLGSGLDIINKLQGVSYIKNKDVTKSTEIGLIAEDVWKIVPDVVKVDGEGRPDSISYGRLVPILIEAVKELSKEIKELKNGTT